MNEKRIQEVIDIETEAEAILLSAQTEADRLPVQAEAEAQELLKKARAGAERDARQMLEKVQAEDQAAAIMSATEDKIRESELLAAKHLDQAVAYVLDQVMGKA